MITKAYIINKEQNSNKYYVRIPIFEKPGINSENSNLSRTHFSATLAHEPTIFDAYNIGDCVFVGFENNELNRPVIIGKLYTKNDVSATSGLIETKVLKVLDKVTLPADTTIGGINFSNISNFFNSINDTLNKKDIFVDSIQFKTNNEGAGLVNFNDKEGLAQITLSPNVTMAIGVDEVLKVYNDTDETLVDGTVVYRTGVKKETNVILEDYQLVSNGENEITFTGYANRPYNDISIIEGNQYYLSIEQKLIATTYSGAYGAIRFLDNPYIINREQTILQDQEYHLFSGIFTSVNTFTSRLYAYGSNIEPTTLYLKNAFFYNITDMKLNSVKNDNGVLFTELTNEEIKTQLDKWIQRGVSGTTKVQPAIANNFTISNNTIGVITEPIASNDYGFISRHGFVGGILLDPNIYTVGQTLYLSPDVEGAFTNQIPVAPNFVTQIGYVNMVSSDSHTADGQIYVDIVSVPVAVIPTPEAIGVITDISQFNTILSSDDINVQHALETLDKHSHTDVTTSESGFMSATDKTKLDASTANNTASTIVTRDSNKDFSANTITTNSIKIGNGEVEMVYDSGSDLVKFIWN